MRQYGVGCIKINSCQRLLKNGWGHFFLVAVASPALTAVQNSGAAYFMVMVVFTPSLLQGESNTWNAVR